MPDEETFSQFMADFGKYSWVVLFAEADFDDVRSAYAQVLNSQDQGLVEVASDRSHELSPSGAVVETNDSKWTIVFHLVGSWSDFDSARLSELLNAKVMEYSAEDTSGSSSCMLYDPTGSYTRYQDASDAEDEAELFDEVNEYAEEMGFEGVAPGEAVEVESYEELFKSVGISAIKLSLADDYQVAVVDQKDLESVGRVAVVRSR